jgi:two-component system response regulator YesN
MLNVLIADDEKIIREGLKECLDWDNMGMRVTAVARDGEEALQLAQKVTPDICLVDIMMPFVTGLEFMEKMKTINPKALCIVVTGHDEFEYAQRAVKLQAFDYILKPIDEGELRRVVMSAKEQLDTLIVSENRLKKLVTQVEKTLPEAVQKFVLDCLYGTIDKEDVEEFQQRNSFSFGERLGVMLIKPNETIHLDDMYREWRNSSLVFAMKNVIGETLESDFSPLKVVSDDLDNLVAVVTINDYSKWMDAVINIQENIKKYLNYRITVYYAEVENGLYGISGIYRRLRADMQRDDKYLPAVKKAKSYVQTCYNKSDLSLNQIADEMDMSVSYLSKLFKQEMGQMFSEYLIETRIKVAIELLLNGNLRIYEIADKVGYSSQHYFCAAFKKVMGCSPSDYRAKQLK